MGTIPEFVREALGDSETDAHDLASTWTLMNETLASSLAPVQVPTPNRLLDLVSSPRLKYAPFFHQLQDLWQLDEAALEAVFVKECWRRTPLPGIRVREVVLPPQLARCRARLSLFDAGTRFPRHTHHAPEHVLVLEGAYTDSDSGVTYGPGDLHSMPAGTTHGFTVATSGRCVAASIHDAPFAFHSWPLRILARLTGN